MKFLVALELCLVGLALARPSDIIDFELDNMEHEQEGEPGRAVEGEYSWKAPDGEEYVVKYKADHMGYRVVESNVVPKTYGVDLDVGVEDEEKNVEETPKVRVAAPEEEEEEENVEADKVVEPQEEEEEGEEEEGEEGEEEEEEDDDDDDDEDEEDEDEDEEEEDDKK